MRKITNQQLNRLSNEQFLITPKIPLVVVLENVRSAMNVGSFFRTADAFVIEKIILCGFTPIPPSKELHKTALGAELTVQWEHFNDCHTAIQTLIEDHYEVIAVEQVEGSVSLENFDVDPSKKYALIFGNEVDGVEQNTVDLVHKTIEIPQAGTKHSLNVSIAGGVVMWHFFSRLRNIIGC